MQRFVVPAEDHAILRHRGGRHEGEFLVAKTPDRVGAGQVNTEKFIFIVAEVSAVSRQRDRRADDKRPRRSG